MTMTNTLVAGFRMQRRRVASLGPGRPSPVLEQPGHAKGRQQAIAQGRGHAFVQQHSHMAVAQRAQVHRHGLQGGAEHQRQQRTRRQSSHGLVGPPGQLGMPHPAQAVVAHGRLVAKVFEVAQAEHLWRRLRSACRRRRRSPGP
jgi:hypothetical protein